MRYFVIILSVLLVLFSFHHAQARIIHVPADSSTIQGGINGAVNGDTVLVAPGTYYEHIDFNGKAILVKSEAGSEGTVVERLYPEVNLLTFQSGEQRSSIIDGFTFQHALGAHAIYCANSSPTIINNIIAENRYDGYYGDGAGLFLDGTHAIVTHNIFRNNSAFYGSAIRTNSADSISSNIFVGNSGVGTIRVLSSQYTFIGKNLLYGNGDYTIFIQLSANVRAIGNTIAFNAAPDGAVAIWASNDIWLVNNIICCNNGLGINAYGGSIGINVLYDDVWNNPLGNYYGCMPGEGCISADPIFCDTASDSYYLSTLSSCVGAGEGGTDIGAFGIGCGIGVDLTSGPNKDGRAETNVSVEFYVTNIGYISDTYDLDITDSLGWSIVPAHYDVTLDSGKADTVTFIVSIPYVPIGTVDKLRLVAVSQANSSVSDTAYLLVTCNAHVEGVEVTPGSNQNGSADSIVSVSFLVQNVGVVRDSYSLDISDTRGWQIVPLHYNIVLDTGQTIPVSFIVSIPNVPIGTTDTITLTAISQSNLLATDTASLLVTCNSYNVTITKISDVGNDQGKQVHIDWSSFPGSDPLVSSFSVFRRKDSLLTSLPVGSPVYLNLPLRYPPGQWEWLFTIPAFGETLYSVVVPTLKDSTIAEGMYWSVFFVRAGTANPIVYFDSPVDSGYSLDNLSPSPPTGLLASHAPAVTKLTWNTTPIPDFDYHTVYRDTIPGFTSSLSNRLGFTIDTTFVDSTAQLGRTFYYLVSATDFSGNESDPSNQAMGVRYITGDANADGQIDVVDLVYLLNYLFIKGPAPAPMQAGDATCDGVIDASDLVYLLNYLFISGPPPSC